MWKGFLIGVENEPGFYVVFPFTHISFVFLETFYPQTMIFFPRNMGILLSSYICLVTFWGLIPFLNCVFSWILVFFENNESSLNILNYFFISSSLVPYIDASIQYSSQHLACRLCANCSDFVPKTLIMSFAWLLLQEAPFLLWLWTVLIYLFFYLPSHLLFKGMNIFLLQLFFWWGDVWSELKTGGEQMADFGRTIIPVLPGFTKLIKSNLLKT